LRETKKYLSCASASGVDTASTDIFSDDCKAVQGAVEDEIDDADVADGEDDEDERVRMCSYTAERAATSQRLARSAPDQPGIEKETER
jgi:hypothetical protein